MGVGFSCCNVDKCYLEIRMTVMMFVNSTEINDIARAPHGVNAEGRFSLLINTNTLFNLYLQI